MSIQPTTHFSALPLSARLTYTMTLLVLGLGYLFAIIHVFASHAGRDGDAGLSVTDLIIAYSGSPADTRLEAALKGPMQGMLPENERAEIIAWVRRGAESAEFGKVVEPVLKERCQSCHDGSNPHIPTLKSAEDVAKLTVRDTGMDIFTLVRVSHIHLFGITFIFFITSSIFSHAWLRPLWLKCAIIAVPFVSIILDIASWYLTKLWPGFAWIVMISGGFMGLSFAAQMLISLWQMWTHFTPEGLSEDGELPHIQ